MTDRKLLTGQVTERDVTTEIDGHIIPMSDSHPSPVDYLLASLAGCAGLTLRRILEKRRVEVDSLELTAEARHTRNPYRIEKITVSMTVRSENLDDAVLNAALDLTEKHCPVGVALGGAVKIRLRGQVLR